MGRRMFPLFLACSQAQGGAGTCSPDPGTPSQAWQPMEGNHNPAALNCSGETCSKVFLCCWTTAALDTRPSFSCSSPTSRPLPPQPGQPSGVFCPKAETFSVATFSPGRKVRLTSPFIPISLYASPILSFCSDCR